MDTFSGLELRQIPLSLPFARKRRDDLLARCGLESVGGDYCIGLYDADDRLMATATLDRDIIKGVAVDSAARDLGLLPALVTELLRHAAEAGIENPKVFTKPEYAPMFASLAFTEVGRGEGAVMLEHSATALADYTAYLRSLPRSGRTGAIVMHANPLTLGHLYLIRKAAGMCRTLFIIPVAENATEFSYAERTDMLRRAVEGMEGVTVVNGSHYAVSRSSFPSYFIKELSARTDAHITLDLDIYRRHIAPALGAEVRFVGSEPSDPLTARYNQLMHQILPEVVEIPRLTDTDGPVSASRVRRLIDEGRAGRAIMLSAATAKPYILARAAAKALRDELDTTPKPGLVDRENSGAHTDMDHSLMMRSISALTPVFARLAMLPADASIEQIRAIGGEGEKLMMEATGGVNTHRGALFSLGLTVVAASRLSAPYSRKALSAEIASLAAGFPRPDDTHGAEVGRRYGVATALDAARAGYPAAFAATPGIDGPHIALLRLMASIDDSNIYHRCGAETAAEVKAKAAALTESYSHEAMRRLDRDFSSRRISPGGAADMLALAMLVESLTNESTPNSIPKTSNHD